MNIVISLVECDGGMWRICRDSVALCDDMRLGPAITLARRLARDEHCRTGCGVSVVLTGPPDGVRLAHYTAEPAAA